MMRLGDIALAAGGWVATESADMEVGCAVIDSRDSTGGCLFFALAGSSTDGHLYVDNVLLVEKNKKTEIGKPLVKGAQVKGKVLKQARAKKVEIVKHKAKKRYNLKKGHRQSYTEVEIAEIKY